MRWTVCAGAPVEAGDDAVTRPDTLPLDALGTVAEDDWVHLVVGSRATSQQLTELARSAGRGDVQLSCEARCAGAAVAGGELWEAFELLLDAVGTQGGLAILGLDDLSELLGERMELPEATDLAEHWAAVHGLCLVVVLDGLAQACAVKPDGRVVAFVHPDGVDVRAGWGEREVFARTFLDGYLVDPADLDGRLKVALDAACGAGLAGLAQ